MAGKLLVLLGFAISVGNREGDNYPTSTTIGGIVAEINRQDVLTENEMRLREVQGIAGENGTSLAPQQQKRLILMRSLVEQDKVNEGGEPTK